MCQLRGGLMTIAALAVAVSAGAIEPLETTQSVFNYLKNGVKIDVRVVPVANDTKLETENFPALPVKDIGHCVVEMSLSCVQRRIARFLDVIGELKEITLLGQSVKLVKLRELPEERVDERRAIAGPGEMIDQSIDDFFDKFALRITMPRWKGKKNQIDLKFEDTEVFEGRGGKGGKMKGGKKKGGGSMCKKMMMMGMVGLKAKMMGMLGMAAMKGMFMSGMSLMISKMMLISQFMQKKGGGGFLGGGGGGCSSGGCGGGGGYAAPSSSYGAPPPSYNPPPPPPPPQQSYGAPAPQPSYSAPQDSYGAPPQTGGGPYGGGGGGDNPGGGGWGRSFRTMTADYASHDYEPMTQDELDVKPITDERWNQDTTWNYTTDDLAPEQQKASQASYEKHETSTGADSRANSLRAVYAKGWKNYEVARNENTKYYPDYIDVRQ